MPTNLPDGEWAALDEALRTGHYSVPYQRDRWADAIVALRDIAEQRRVALEVTRAEQVKMRDDYATLRAERDRLRGVLDDVDRWNHPNAPDMSGRATWRFPMLRSITERAAIDAARKEQPRGWDED